MRTSPWLLKVLQSVSSSRPIVIVAVFVSALTVSPNVRADHQKDKATLSVCCGGDCATASCNLDAEILVSTTSNTCSPDCFLTALLIQPDSSVSAGCGVDATSSFRFVRESSTCVEDVGSPFSLPFFLNTPFLVTNAEWLDYIDPNTVIEAETVTAGVTVTGEKQKTTIGNSGEVPAASTWGLLVLGIFVLSGGTLAIRRRSIQSTA